MSAVTHSAEAATQAIATNQPAADLSIFSLISSADIVGKGVMVLLVLASVWTWAIIIEKILKIRTVNKKISAFEATFWSGQVLDQLYESVKRGVDNSLAAVFLAAMNEFKRVGNNKSSEITSLKIGHKERVFQAMNLVKNREMEALDKNINMLAIVGSNAPFVGLFGTVWGIMHCFQSIAISKNTTLAVVAPGFAEALLATALGLVVAIPAVIFYGYLSKEVDTVHNKIDDFMGELGTILSRAIDEERH